MTSFEDLPPDQRAVLSLLLRRRKSYDEVAAALGIAPVAVHDRAHAGLAVLAPQKARALDADTREHIGEYLLGCQDDVQAATTKATLAQSAPAREWARALAVELVKATAEPLPEIPGPDIPGGSDAGAHTAPGPAPAPADQQTAPTDQTAPADQQTAPADQQTGPTDQTAPADQQTAPTDQTAPADQQTAPPAQARPADQQTTPAAAPAISRRGGALLLAGIVVVAAVVVAVILSSGGSGNSANQTASHSHEGSTSAQESGGSGTEPGAGSGRSGTGEGTGSGTGEGTGSGTGSSGPGSGKSPKLEKAAELKPVQAGAHARGAALIAREGSKRGVYLSAEGLPASEGFSYVVWLIHRDGHIAPLGRTPSVGSDGRVAAVEVLAEDPRSLTGIELTRETATHPSTPGTVVLKGRFVNG